MADAKRAVWTRAEEHALLLHYLDVKRDPEVCKDGRMTRKGWDIIKANMAEFSEHAKSTHTLQTKMHRMTKEYEMFLQLKRNNNNHVNLDVRGRIVMNADAWGRLLADNQTNAQAINRLRNVGIRHLELLAEIYGDGDQSETKVKSAPSDDDSSDVDGDLDEEAEEIKRAQAIMEAEAEAKAATPAQVEAGPMPIPVPSSSPEPTEDAPSNSEPVQNGSKPNSSPTRTESPAKPTEGQNGTIKVEQIEDNADTEVESPRAQAPPRAPARRQKRPRNAEGRSPANSQKRSRAATARTPSPAPASMGMDDGLREKVSTLVSLATQYYRLKLHQMVHEHGEDLARRSRQLEERHMVEMELLRVEHAHKRDQLIQEKLLARKKMQEAGIPEEVINHTIPM